MRLEDQDVTWVKHVHVMNNSELLMHKWVDEPLSCFFITNVIITSLESFQVGLPSHRGPHEPTA
eukprot:scaffold18496_cov35-Tisochrysis_lutea.AAC.1